MSTDPARERAVHAHRRVWGEPQLLVRAPGRVNLIGEHTDYNDGFVLPMALPLDTVFAVSAAGGGSTTIRSEGFGEAVVGRTSPSWAAHMLTMIEIMAADGIAPPGWRATVATDIPTGASLSSSAAAEVGVGLVIAAMAGAPVDPLAIAEYGRQVESRLMGSPTGIMDQLVSATGIAGSALLIDCRSLEASAVALPDGTAVVVMDTTTRRELVDSEFASRMGDCRRAAEILGVPALRDIDAVDDLTALRADHELEWRRATHVVAENGRTRAAADAMAAGDAVALGALMSESHRSLRDLFEVSSQALDTIVEVALASPGCLGARMTGGGFAGCAVALVDAPSALDFRSAVVAGYETATGMTPRLWICEPGDGATIEWMEPG